MKNCRYALISAILLSSVSALAADANYRIVERIKVPDGGFDYATFDAATGNVYMPRGDFTSVIDVKTGKVSQLASGQSNHIALPIPGTNLMLFTHSKGLIRIADKATD